MPVKKLRGLDGLKGLGALSDEEYEQWWEENQPYIKGKSIPYIHRLYANQVFVKKFGRELFDSMNAQQRDEYAKAWFVQEGFDDKFKPKSEDDSNTSNAQVYNQFNGMDTQAKLELLNSNYVSLEDIQAQRDSIIKAADDAVDYSNIAVAMSSVQGVHNFNYLTVKGIKDGAEMGYNTKVAERQALLNKIQADYLERQTSKHSKEINQTAQKIKEEYSEEDIDKAFWNAVDTKNGPGNNYFNAYRDESELSSFDTDDKAKYLAEYAVLSQIFNNSDLYTYLNNQAKDYIADNQSWMTKKLLGVRNIGVSAAAYLAQSTVGSVGYIAAMSREAAGEKPEVWMDNEGNIYDEDKVHGFNQENTEAYVILNDCKIKVTKQQIDPTSLFMAGKNSKGEDLFGWWNMDYLEKAQRYNTFDDDVINSAEQNGGVSIYNTATHVGDDAESLTMEVLRMTSFGLVDLAMTLLPSGGGAVAKGVKFVSSSAKAAANAAKAAKFMSRAKNVLNQARSTSGIALAYGKGVYDEALQINLDKANEAILNQTHQAFVNWKENNSQEYENLVNQAIEDLKKELENNANNNSTDDPGYKSVELDETTLRNIAEQQVVKQKMQEFYDEISNSEQAFENIAEARRDASSAAFNLYLTEAGKYAIVNASWRSFLFRTPVQQTQYAMKAMTRYIKEEGAAGAKKWVQQEWKRMPEFGRAASKTFFGGAWTNFTDEMQSDFAVGLNNSFYDNFMAAQNNGEALVKAFEDREWTRALFMGLDEAEKSLYKESTWRAGLAGGAGSILPNPIKILNVPAMLSQRKAFEAELDELVSKNAITEAEKNQRLAIYNNRSFLEKLNDWISLGGIAETYYGNKNAYRQLGFIASQVNKDLDNIDWNVLKAAYYNTDDNFGTHLDDLDKKDSEFIYALFVLRALSHLQKVANMEQGEDANYAALLRNSSVLKEATSLIEAVENDGDFSDAQKEELLNEYYANNSSEARSEENDEKALNSIRSNVKKLIEVRNGIQEAEQKLDELESQRGEKIDKEVRNQLIFHMAFLANNLERVSSLELEISNEEDNAYAINLTTVDGKRKYLLTFGDKKSNIEDHVEVLNTKIKEVTEEKERFEKEKLDPARKELEKAKQELENSTEDYERQTKQQAITKAEAKVRNLENTLSSYNKLIGALEDRKSSIETNIYRTEEVTEDYNGTTTKPLSVEEDIIGATVDLNDTKSIDAAIEKILKLPTAERARLFESIKEAIKQAEETKKQTKGLARTQRIFSDRNFEVLEAIYNRINATNPKLLDKIKDVNILQRRTRELQQSVDFATRDPEAVADRLSTLEAEERVHAQALWDKHIADAYNERYSTYYKYNISTLKNGGRTRRQREKEVYRNMFYSLLGTNKSILYHIVNHKDDYAEGFYEAVAAALKFKEKLGDINEIAKTVLLNGKSEEALNKTEKEAIEEEINALNEALLSNLDSDMPIAEDLLHALAVIENSELGKDYNINAIIEGLTNIDNQRSSTFVDDAKKHINTAARKRHYKVVEKTRQQQREKAERQAQIEAQKKAEAERKAKEEAERKAKEEAEKKAQEGNASNKNEIGEGAIDMDSDNDEVLPQLSKDTVIFNDLKEGSTFNDKNGKEYKVIKVSDGKVTFKPTDSTSESEQEGSNETTVSSQRELNEFLEKIPTTDEAQLDPLTKNPISVSESNPESVDIPISDLAKEAQEKPGGEKITIVTTEPPTQDLNPSNDEVPNVLLGYLWSEYNYQDLLNGRAGRKIPQRKGDAYSQYFSWIDKQGIKLQNIVDYELGDIIRNNPNTVIYVMHSNDSEVSNILFNVIEYTDDVKKYHNEENGGVITGSDGKQYLIVGASGYDKRQSSQETAWRAMRTNIQNEHRSSDSDFFISKYHTKVNKLKGGYIVQQLPKDKEPAYRPVTELLNDKDRNPKGLQVDDLVWGIQKTSDSESNGFVTVNMGSRQFVIPNSEESNLGNVFLFVEGANGVMIPTKIKPLYLKDLDRESDFGKRLINSLTELINPDLNKRLEALRKVNRLLYLTNRDRTRTDKTSSQGKVIRVGDANHNVIELYDGDVKIATFNINDALDITEFIDTIFNTFNPRVQITPEMLSDVTTIKELAAAGALNTDMACLHTVGAEYFINGMDSEGKPQESAPVSNRTEITKKASDKTSVLYNGTTYYKSTDDTWYSKNGDGIIILDKIRDANILTQIEYNQEIADTKPGQKPDYKEGQYDYYIMKQGDEPLVYKRNKNTNYVEPLSKDVSQEIIDKITKEITDKKAADKAKEKNDQLGEDAVDMKLNNDDQATAEKAKKKKGQGIEDNKGKTLDQLRGQGQSGSKSFIELASNDILKVLEGLSTKYPEVANMTDLNDVNEFLKSKNIEVDNISQDLDSWLEYVKNCK